jgi:hypothetical protein
MRFWELPRIEQYRAIKRFEFKSQKALDVRYDVVLVPMAEYTTETISDLRVYPRLTHNLQTAETQQVVRALLNLLTLEPYIGLFQLRDSSGFVFERNWKPELVLAILVVRIDDLETTDYSIEEPPTQASWWPWIIAGLAVGVIGFYTFRKLRV